MSLFARHSALSDIGLHRQTNEDTFVVAPPLYVVCDGMGGARAGEVASSLAGRTLAEKVAEGLPLLAAAEAANAAVFECARADSARSGMGTTLTAVLLEGASGHFVHIGDSRAYILRDGELMQVSSDHSLVAEMVREGRLSEDEATVHPQRSILSRALGTDEVAQIDEFMVDLQAGDRILLCSDGLTGPVPAAIIARALSLPDLEQAASTLVREALQRGGPDNITVVAILLEDPQDEESEEVTEITRAADGSGADEVTRVMGEDQPPDGPRVRSVAGVVAHEAVATSDEPPDLETSADQAAAGTAEAATSRRRLGCLAAGLAALVVLGVAGVVMLSSVFFISVDEDRLAVYSGLPVSVGPVALHAVYRTSSLPYSSLSEQEKTVVDEREMRSRDNAMQLARALGMWP